MEGGGCGWRYSVDQKKYWNTPHPLVYFVLVSVFFFASPQKSPSFLKMAVIDGKKNLYSASDSLVFVILIGDCVPLKIWKSYWDIRRDDTRKLAFVEFLLCVILGIQLFLSSQPKLIVIQMCEVNLKTLTSKLRTLGQCNMLFLGNTAQNGRRLEMSGEAGKW